MILAPPKPRLWVPSLADAARWMAHLCKDPATGHLRKSGSAPKNLLRTCGCRGCPDTLTLTSTSIASNGCIAPSGTAGYRRLDGSANGSWTLNRSGTSTTPCTWLAATTIGIGRYNTACAFLIDTVNPQWALTTSDGTNFQLILLFAGLADFTVFNATVQASGTCTTSLLFNNAATGGDLGSAGSVTVTP